MRYLATKANEAKSYQGQKQQEPGGRKEYGRKDDCAIITVKWMARVLVVPIMHSDGKGSNDYSANNKDQHLTDR